MPLPDHPRKPTVAIVTVGRSDYGIYRPLLERLRTSRRLRLRLLVSGMHLAPEFGHTVDQIRQDGFGEIETIPMLLSSDDPAGVGLSLGQGVAGFTRSFAQSPPEVLVVLGDRFEMFAAAVAAAPFNLPVLHIHGGELTEGAMDDSLRHALTKLSHLHCVATEDYRRRVLQLGESPWRVTVTGALSLDGLDSLPLLSRRALERRFGLELTPPPLLVTFHPVTKEGDQTETQLAELFQALARSRLPVVFTLPNADPHGRFMADQIRLFVRRRRQAWLVENFGRVPYFSMLKHAAAMVGNSSSGLIEAPSFGLPVVNIGRRQQGRVRGQNVLDVNPTAVEILAGIRTVLAPEFRRAAAHGVNPYRRGDAAALILERLEHLPPRDELLTKRFCDWPDPAAHPGCPS